MAETQHVDHKARVAQPEFRAWYVVPGRQRMWYNCFASREVLDTNHESTLPATCEDESVENLEDGEIYP